MANIGISIDFSGYWDEYNKGSMPAASGVFCVYGGFMDQRTKVVEFHRLIHIGSDDNVRECLAQHDQIGLWRRCLKRGDALFFNYGPVAPHDRLRSEAALTFRHKPPTNQQYLNSFPFETTVLRVRRRAPLLARRFTVRPADQPGGEPRCGWSWWQLFC